MSAAGILKLARNWAETEPDVHAMLLVGSQARGTARADSDIDIVILTERPERFLGNHEWINFFGRVREVTVRQYGPVTSLFAKLEGAPVLELSIAPLSWAGVDPVDPGTAAVVKEGAHILWDPRSLLERLLARVTG